MSCLRCLLHASALQALSVIISELAASQFSLMISEPTGAVCADESMHHPRNQFC